MPQPDETRQWMESGTVLGAVVGGPARGAMLDELTKMVRDLQIIQARRAVEARHAAEGCVESKLNKGM